MSRAGFAAGGHSDAGTDAHAGGRVLRHWQSSAQKHFHRRRLVVRDHGGQRGRIVTNDSAEIAPWWGGIPQHTSSSSGELADFPLNSACGLFRWGASPMGDGSKQTFSAESTNNNWRKRGHSNFAHCDRNDKEVDITNASGQVSHNDVFRFSKGWTNSHGVPGKPAVGEHRRPGRARHQPREPSQPACTGRNLTRCGRSASSPSNWRRRSRYSS